MRKLKVYIASPYTHGDTGVNVKTNMEMAMLLLDNGYIPFAPLLTHFLHIMSPRSYDTWVEYDNEWVEACDILLRLPGYSKGADAEVALAEKFHIPIVYSMDELDQLRQVLIVQNTPPVALGPVTFKAPPDESIFSE